MRGRGKTRTDKSDVSGIRTVHVAAKILAALAEYRDPVRVTDLARKLGMTMPTVSRHLSTWRDLGFVDKPDGQETYRLGTKLFTLGQAAAEQNTHVSVAYPFLAELREKVRETVFFATRFQDQAIALICLDSGRPTTVVMRPGTILSMPLSPTARVLWTFGRDAMEKLDDMARKFDYANQSNFTQETFKKRVKAALRNWYDYEIEVRESGLGAISCPIFEHSNDVVAAVTLLLPSALVGDPPDKALVDRLKNCSAAISEALGSTAWKR